jgi:prophage regulatory protein
VESCTAPDPLAIIFFDDLSPRYGVSFSRVHLRRLEAKGKFPHRFFPTPGRAAWLQSEIRAWLAARIAQRDALPHRQLPPPDSRFPQRTQPRPRIVRGAAGRRAAA